MTPNFEKYEDRSENEIQLKRNHDYHFQIQGQLHITGKNIVIL